jgi:hypothetical protein
MEGMVEEEPMYATVKKRASPGRREGFRPYQAQGLYRDGYQVQIITTNTSYFNPVRVGNMSEMSEINLRNIRSVGYRGYLGLGD